VLNDLRIRLHYLAGRARIGSSSTTRSTSPGS
jgi:hypothetical protein